MTGYDKWKEQIMTEDNPDKYVIYILINSIKQYINSPNSLTAKDHIKRLIDTIERYLKEN